MTSAAFAEQENKSNSMGRPVTFNFITRRIGR